MRACTKAIAAAAAAALLAAGCTGSGALEGQARPSGPGSGLPGDPALGEASVSALPSPSGPFAPDDEILTVATKAPSTLDPMRVADPGSVLMVRQLYEGLTRWDALEDRVRPAAARSWNVADGGRTFTFKLRPGMTFHDGSPVRAKDFKFAFDRIARKSSASDLAYLLERVEGFEEANGLGETPGLSGVSARGDLTLSIRLSEPFYELPAVLTHPALVPLPAKAVRKYDEFLSQPVGNGPFQMAQEWTAGDPVLVEDFPGFIDTPKTDGIRFVPSPDAAASWPLFVDERMDVAEVPAGQVTAAANIYGDEGYVPFLGGYYFGVNVRTRAARNLRTRKAISRSIDRDAIAELVYRGSMQPARGIVPTGMPGFQENICVPLCRHSPKAAKQLLKKVPRRARRVWIEFDKGEPHKDVVRLVKKDLKATGFRVAVRGYDFSRYVQMLRGGARSIYRLGWIAEYPSPDVFLSPLFQSDSPDNHSGFASAKVDALLRAAHAERSDARRLQLYIKAEKLILAEVPIVPVGSFVTHWAAQPWVHGIVFDESGGFDAAQISIGDKPAE